ncbi:MAG TPA: carboxypeptidase-like regulatory domain-containing protein [Candidatus Sulfopaludibacter sp.]|nr:carboxypeptidase-like regulatory domain-containing protein [Candidatus Sulfopaludibacter sp.]
MRRSLICALAAGALHAAVVRGVVVEHQTGKPLSRVVVTLRPLGGTPAGVQTVRTNVSGVFDFPPVPGGSYIVSAARRNFFTIQYGQKDWRSAGAPVVINETESAFLNIRLPRLGVITGRVVDENDVGLPNHEVVAYRNTRPPQLAARVTADERGIYRFFDLDPGSYLVRTVAREYEEGGYLPTFSKNTSKVEEARPVDVQLDQEAVGVDVMPATGRIYKVAGAVHPGAMITEGPGAGSPVPVKLTMASDMGRETTVTSSAFRFPPQAPGHFELYAEGPGDGNCFMVGGYMTFDISDKDRTDLSLNVPCVRETTVQLVESGGQAMDASAVAVLARRKDLAGTGDVQQLLISGSRYSARARLGPGRWELRAIPPGGYCVVEFGYRRLRSEGVERTRADGWNEVLIDNGYNPIRFVFSKNPGSIHGLVSGIAHEPVSGAPVFLEGYDAESRRRVAELRTVYTDTTGHYRITGLTPGSYRVLASFEFLAPDSDTMEMAGAKLITIEEGHDLPQDLDLSVIR